MITNITYTEGDAFEISADQTTSTDTHFFRYFKNGDVLTLVFIIIITPCPEFNYFNYGYPDEYDVG